MHSGHLCIAVCLSVCLCLLRLRYAPLQWYKLPRVLVGLLVCLIANCKSMRHWQVGSLQRQVAFLILDIELWNYPFSSYQHLINGVGAMSQQKSFRKLSFFYWEGGRLSVITGHQFFLVPPLACAKNSGPLLACAKKFWSPSRERTPLCDPQRIGHAFKLETMKWTIVYLVSYLDGLFKT